LLAATGTVSGASANGLTIGTVGATNAGFGAGTTVNSVTFTNTPAATYTLTSVAAGTLRLSNGTLSQDITVADNYSANTNTTLTFSQFGVSFGLTFTAATAKTDIHTGVGSSARTTVVTNSGPNAMDFQSGADILDTFRFQTLNAQTDGNSVTGSLGRAVSDAVTALSGNATSANFTTINTAVDNMITGINSSRATFGAQMNRVSYISSQLLTQSGNLQQSRSSLIDTDFAAETARLTKGQIMQQAATAMLAQANQMPNVILSLLK